MFERPKTVHALDRASSGTGYFLPLSSKYSPQRPGSALQH